MTNNQYRIEFTSDLSRGITVTPIRFALLSNENMAHAFVIKTTRNGQKNDLTGSNVRAYFIPASQNLSVLIDGEVDQNGNAVIELTKDCYYYTGRFFLIIETEMDNVTSCIFYGDGYVTKTSTDEIVAPPETVGIISAVLYNKPQSLTDAQKQQARANIGAISEVDVPQKGVDYWTPADQESIVQQVIAALGMPVFGRVDENNNIILTGELADGTYTVKYEDVDGNLVDVGTIEQGGVYYTNQLPLAIASDKTPFNGGQGWKTGYRLNSTGEETAMDGMEVTGFIPVKHGDVVRLKNVGWTSGASQTYAWCYDSSFNYIAYINAADVSQVASDYVTLDISGNLVQFTADANFFKVVKSGAWSEINGKIAYFRINCADISENSIITVNQPIE